MFLLASLGIAYAQPGPSSPPLPGTYKLEGVVLNSQSAEPVAHALVELFGPPERAVLTGADGRFAFEKLPAGWVSISARKPGYFAPGANLYSSLAKSVEIGPATSKAELKLIPERMITGHVEDQGGEPIEGAAIQVIERRLFQGTHQFIPIFKNIVTDENGDFRISSLWPGEYYVAVKSVRERALETESKERERAYPAILYYPDAGDISAALPVSLKDKQRIQLQFLFKRVPTFKLGGLVSGISSFKELNPPMIVDEAQQFLFMPDRWNQATGTFEFSTLPPGTYTVVLAGHDAAGHSLSVKQAITVDGDRTDLNLFLSEGIAIPVLFREELSEAPGPFSCAGGIHLNGRLLDCHELLASVSLVPRERSGQDLSAMPSEDDPPRPELHPVMPGRYRVRVTPVRSDYVYSVRSGSTDLLRDDLLVTSAGSVPPIEVVLRDGGAMIKIHVQSDVPPPGTSQILLWPEFAPNQPPFVLNINPNGDREYGNLAPGDYKVWAFSSLDGMEYNNPEVLQKYSFQAAHVTLAAHSTTSVTVDLVHIGDSD